MGILFLGLFLVELVVLFFSSRLLLGSLAQLLMGWTGSREVTIKILAILFLPGTMVHELAHVLSAGVLQVPTGEIEFMPQVLDGGEGVKLGSAQIAKTDIVR